MNVFVFDIETVPDVGSARRVWGLEGLDDDAVASVMYSKRLQETAGSNDFLRHHLHRVVAIAAVYRADERLKVWSLGDEEADEPDLVGRFFEGIERYTPTLVSWNGNGFDLPVLHYRALLHGIEAPRYWENGDEDRAFRYNNYLGRFHWRHVDLMDVLAGYQPRAVARLDEIATMLGFPGKLGMSGADVWPQYRAGNLRWIRAYCETDVLNTYLVYLRFQRLRGHLHSAQMDAEMDRLREYLGNADAAHLGEFLDAWNASRSDPASAS